MLHVTFGTYNPLKSAKNIKKTIKNKALVRFRNTRTPWIPNDGCSKSRQRQIRKDQNTSKIRAHAKQKTRRQSLGPVPEHPHAVDSERWLLKVSSASDSKRPKHQQDSSPCQAKNTQTECFTSPLEPIKNKASVPKHPNASSSRASAKQKTVRNAHITTSKNVDSERWLLKVSSASDSKRPKHQQDSSP